MSHYVQETIQECGRQVAECKPRFNLWDGKVVTGTDATSTDDSAGRALLSVSERLLDIWGLGGCWVRALLIRARICVSNDGLGKV